MPLQNGNRGSKPAEVNRKSWLIEGIPLSPGQIYSFKTRPYTRFSPPDTGRYGAIRIIGVGDVLSDKRWYAVFVTLDGIWPAAPVWDDVERAEPLREQRFGFQGSPATYLVSVPSWKPEHLNELTLVGTKPLTTEERSYMSALARREVATKLAALSAGSSSAEGEWRWANDRSALTSENEKEIAARKLDNAATVARTRDRMSKLTWETLLSNALFDDWSAPKAIVGAARDKIQETCRAMRDLGPKPRRAEVRAILKAAVQWFNEANLEAGGVIDTIAREDICRVLEDILFVARQPALADEIDGWRDW